MCMLLRSHSTLSPWTICVTPFAHETRLMPYCTHSSLQSCPLFLDKRSGGLLPSALQHAPERLYTQGRKGGGVYGMTHVFLL
jgi:hypothetical protein